MGKKAAKAIRQKVPPVSFPGPVTVHIAVTVMELHVGEAVEQ
jgi:hypothetical protein